MKQATRKLAPEVRLYHAECHLEGRTPLATAFNGTVTCYYVIGTNKRAARAKVREALRSEACDVQQSMKSLRLTLVKSGISSYY